MTIESLIEQFELENPERFCGGLALSDKVRLIAFIQWLLSRNLATLNERQ